MYGSKEKSVDITEDTIIDRDKEKIYTSKRVEMNKCGNKKILFKKFTSVFYLLKKNLVANI